MDDGGMGSIVINSVSGVPLIFIHSPWNNIIRVLRYNVYIISFYYSDVKSRARSNNWWS